VHSQDLQKSRESKLRCLAHRGYPSSVACSAQNLCLSLFNEESTSPHKPSRRTDCPFFAKLETQVEIRTIDQLICRVMEELLNNDARMSESACADLEHHDIYVICKMLLLCACMLAFKAQRVKRPQTRCYNPGTVCLTKVCCVCCLVGSVQWLLVMVTILLVQEFLQVICVSDAVLASDPAYKSIA